jgi:lysyl-tRNA synthetase class II
MNVVDLVKDAELYIGKEVTVTGRLDRPRKRNSSYLFFNVDNGSGVGVQAVIKEELLGKERFKELIYGLCHTDTVTVTGSFDLRSSPRTDFYKYEVTVSNVVRVGRR